VIYFVLYFGSLCSVSCWSCSSVVGALLGFPSSSPHFTVRCHCFYMRTPQPILLIFFTSLLFSLFFSPFSSFFCLLSVVTQSKLLAYSFLLATYAHCSHCPLPRASTFYTCRDFRSGLIAQPQSLVPPFHCPFSFTLPTSRCYSFHRPCNSPAPHVESKSFET